jgi:transcriptional regulator with XRE-family HTH domain
MAREPFGTRLRSLRERVGISPAQLATIAGFKEDDISRWERNLAQPEIATAECLAGILGVSAVELLTGRPEYLPRPTIRLTADNFADHLPTKYVVSLVKGFVMPADGIDVDNWVVRELLIWVELQNERSPGVWYEMSRLTASVFLQRLAGRP